MRRPFCFRMCGLGHVSHEELLAEGVLPSLVRISETSAATSEAKTLPRDAQEEECGQGRK